MKDSAFIHSISLPANASAVKGVPEEFRQEFLRLSTRLEDEAATAAITAFSVDARGQHLLASIAHYSPYLSQSLLRHMPFFGKLCAEGVAWAEQHLLDALANAEESESREGITRRLRIAKSQAALLTALADLGGVWALEKVTGFLSEIASLALQRSLDFLFLDAKKRGELADINAEKPSENSGFIVLGMGKLGAYELNYSSDIDLILLFEAERMHYTGKQSLQHCMNRIARDLVTIMQERTQDGYVFRTDIRLRPDPASTPPAISVGAAITYYETTGQNWERAAMIKARAVAGDMAAGQRFLKSLTPFIWRRNLDFAAIADIHSIKRQIDHRSGNQIQVAGHNVKLGLGGIREIEFLAQVQQLIWGGRNSTLRERATCDTLYQLAASDLIPADMAIELKDSYQFLRMVEHRVQMQGDQQSHSLPTETQALEGFARFAGFDDLAVFSKALLFHLHRVQAHYRGLYQQEEHSLGLDGSLVFTGVEPDPETVQTLQRMGFTQAETLCGIIMNWHRGHRRATRNKRARELLTELMPTLLKALAATANPDAAFHKFDEFIDKLPGGVQIFSLFAANPQLLKLIADIMGSAPGLAETLSRHPSLLDSVLTGAFYEPLPDKATLQEELARLMKQRAAYDDTVNILCQFRNEKAFQAGIQLLHGMAGYVETGRMLSDVAEVVLGALKQQMLEDFSRTYGHIPGGELAIVAMGKLGAQELTFASDLDLTFVYRTPSPDSMSDGEKSFSGSVYYGRFCQRLIGALSSLNREGRLYEVDTRLRPLGNDGPLATSFEGYDNYFSESAWTFEFMALTKARVVVGDEKLTEDVTATITRTLSAPRDREHIRHDVAQMREKVAREFGTDNPWHIKYARGGMMDIDFIRQYLALTHQTIALPELDAAHAFFTHLLHLLRLCSDGSLDEQTAPEGLKVLLAERLGYADFDGLKAALLARLARVSFIYKHHLAQDIAYD